MKNQKSLRSRLFNWPVCFFVGAFTLLFISGCSNELYEDSISKEQRTQSETVSFKDVYNGIDNPLIKRFMKTKLKPQLTINSLARADEELIDFEKIIKDGDYATYLRADGFITFGNRGQLRKVLGLAKGNPNQAHHIIAWASEVTEHVVVQRAATNGFHMNEAVNGLAVAHGGTSRTTMLITIEFLINLTNCIRPTQT